MDKPRRDFAGVGGRLRQRLAQILLHSSCTTTTAAAASPTVFVSLAKTNAAAHVAGGAHQPRPKIDGSSVRRRRRRSGRALVHISIDCAGATSARHSVRSVPPAPAPALAKNVVKPAGAGSKARDRKSSHRPRSSSYSCSSSTITGDELALFSSDGERGADMAGTRSAALFSSRSFSSDSTSDFYATTRLQSKRNKKTPSLRSTARRKPPGTAGASRAALPVEVAAASHDEKDGVDVAKKKGEAGGSMAVVKRSRNPYADFRSSMVEMVAERRIWGADAMGDLLVAYLTLNSRRHHPAILAAFQDVWEVVFGKEP